jgi:enamine deaminase RidA (YjgF/YER057c/UK114 family)
MIKRLVPGKRLSQATIHGNTVYLAGQVPDDYSGDILEQTKQVLAKIDALLKDSGTDKTKMLSVTVWLPSMGDFAKFNTVWDAWVPADATPARACVEARLADPSIKVEIAVIAAIS